MSHLPGARRLILVAVLLSFFPATPAFSRSLNQTIEKVLEAHPGLKALESAVHAAEAAVDAAGAWPDPQLSWSTAPETYSHDRQSPRQIYAISQRLPWQGKRELERQVQRSEADASRDDMADLRLTLANRVRQLHAQWVYLQAALRINADNQQLIQDLSQVALQAYAVGHSTQAGATRAQLRLSVLRQGALQLGSQIQSLQAQWRSLQVEVSPETIRPVAATSLPALPAEAELLEAARRAHPELAALSDRIAAHAQREARARKEYWPDLTLRLSYVGTLDPQEKRSQIGLSVDVPIDLERRRSAVAMAAARQQQLHWQRDDRLASIEAELRSSLALARAADEQRSLFREALLPQARSHLDAALSAWRAGQGDFSSVIASEEQLLGLRMGLEMAVRDAHVHRSMLDRLSGGQLTHRLFGDQNS